MACCTAVLSSLSAEAISTLEGANLSPADVIAWIALHGHQGADLFRKLLPNLGFTPQVQAVILTILDILYPPTSSPV